MSPALTQMVVLLMSVHHWQSRMSSSSAQIPKFTKDLKVFYNKILKTEFNAYQLWRVKAWCHIA
jgi:hypothetical protein